MCSHRGFNSLHSIIKRRLIDSLCSNQSVLHASTGALLSAPDDEASKATAAAQHRSALKTYVFLLHWIMVQAEAQAKADAGLFLHACA